MSATVASKFPNRHLRAVFLDRDGTLIVDKHYLSKVEDIQYFSDTFKALGQLQRADYELFVVTNQSGVSRGLVTEEMIQKIHDKINQDLMAASLLPIKEFRYNTELPGDKGPLRKPSPLMINQLIDKYQIDRESSYMVGNRPSDYLAGVNAKLKSFLVYEKHMHEGAPIPFFDSLLSFSNYLLSQST